MKNLAKKKTAEHPKKGGRAVPGARNKNGNTDLHPLIADTRLKGGAMRVQGGGGGGPVKKAGRQVWTRQGSSKQNE